MVKQFFYSVFAFMGLFLWNGCDSGSDPKTSIGSITSPTVGQKFIAGENIVITWAGGASAVKVTGRLSGQNFVELSPSATGTGTVTIKAPDVLSDKYEIKLQNTEDPSDEKTVEVALKAIILENPKTGQSINRGTDVTVSWQAHGAEIGGVLINVSTNNGSCWVTLNESGQADKEEDFTWSVGSEPASPSCNLTYPSTQVLVRISDYQDISKYDVSGMLSVN